jgi:precorrin-8X/cobalt-precorrin-8 methylmutase
LSPSRGAANVIERGFGRRRIARFRSYIAVDWSGASVPRSGRDSIWIAAYSRGQNRLARVALENPPTRDAATRRLADLIAASAQAGRVLVGFDFPFGYVRGTAARLGLKGPPWRATWRALSDAVRDDAANANNRFDVAEDLNRRLGGEAFPFWGNVREEARPFLLRRGRRPHGPHDLAERRHADAAVPGTHTVWQLAGNGSVGSQMLLGIPRVWQLRCHPRLAAISAIWPFETGLADDPDKPAIFAEAYPSLVAPDPWPDLPKDAGQVTALAKHLAQQDSAGLMPRLFAADRTLGAAARRAVVEEEAWILGVTGEHRKR